MVRLLADPLPLLGYPNITTWLEEPGGNRGAAGHSTPLSVDTQTTLDYCDTAILIFFGPTVHGYDRPVAPENNVLTIHIHVHASVKCRK